LEPAPRAPRRRPAGRSRGRPAAGRHSLPHMNTSTQPGGEAAVVLRDVHKSFGANKVLSGVNLQAQRGQVTAIIGRSGSGKSTALRCIDRLEKVDSGQITVCGRRVDDPAVDLKALRLDLGLVFQGYNLFPHLNIEENIMLAPRAAK